MRPDTSSASSSSSLATDSSKRSHKRKWSRQQLLRSLEILGNLAAPLPPTLPPSPPASRSSSPAPGSSKRKSDATIDHEPVKRPRTSSVSERPHHHHHHHLPPAPPPAQHLRAPQPNPAYVVRSEPCEDGEVREEPPVASSSHTTPVVMAPPPTTVPIRRPKRGKPSIRHFDSLHDKYHNAGRMLKYSGDARFWSTYPATHREYRPLLEPPSSSSPYHKHGGLIARLELVDALVCFTYSIWNKDYSRRSCNRETWATIEAFLAWCKQKWQAEEGIHDAEKAFLGLIWMIEGFIQGRKMVYNVRTNLDPAMEKLWNECKDLCGKAAAKAEEDSLSGTNSNLLAPKSSTPPMLPSPASIATANSANSTPTNRDSGTPNTFGGRSNHASAASVLRPPGGPIFGAALAIPQQMLPDHLKKVPVAQPVMDAMAAVTLTIGPNLIGDLKDQTAGINGGAYCLNNAQTTLNLPIMARFFPTTFARMIHTTLSPIEEHEPDFEDEEGELFWPGQASSGEGLGWVCLMGKAMIKEFGKNYAYRGLDGVVPKPKPEEEGNAAAPPAHSSHQRPGFTPQGHTPVASVQR